MATNFLSRWSKRKLEGEDTEPDAVSATEQTESLDDSEFTSIDTSIEADDPITIEPQVDDNKVIEPKEESVASLLVSEADSSIKKAALRKLFLSGEFSEVDRMNDYDHDYASVKSLSSEVAEKLRDWMNQEEEPVDGELANSDDMNTEVEQVSEMKQAEADVEEELSTLDASETTPSEISEQLEQEVGQNIPHKK
ncbi:DUF3306 domain-containing protein [Vibrio atypicus]|uniref:DUF3306 domain-containing protein n=1 Tax=Vibrio atypicus TaxID=558271 RepID=UPI001357C1DB|nr:DUF3306 domain-containing protein [Vibrio atypicus]